MLYFPLIPHQCAITLNGQRTLLSLNVDDQATKGWDDYEFIVVVDGAWEDFIDSEIGQYIQKNDADKLTVLGDGDSIGNRPPQFIHTPNQNYTDFEKALHYLIEKGINSVDVFWASGGEMDHFLGNLSVAAKYADKIIVRFIDTNQCYTYVNAPDVLNIDNAKGKTISIYPFPEAVMESHGLEYPLNNLILTLHRQQSLRNQVIIDSAQLKVFSGAAWVFISL